MIIPFQRLSREALNAVLEEYVTRDGTEFTDVEAKKNAVLLSLQSGELVLHYDSATSSCNILGAGIQHDAPTH